MRTLRTTRTTGTLRTSGHGLTYKGPKLFSFLTLIFGGLHCTPHPKCENAPFSERPALNCDVYICPLCPLCPHKMCGVSG